jgi:hypothetical protein
MNYLRILKSGLLPALFLLTVTSGFSQAYCLLRDPDREINRLYPDHDSKKSSVGKIDRKVYDEVSKRLGTFTLYFSELGRHTMYVPHKDGKPMGLVHSRAVETKVGLFEVVWAYDLDLKVKDFTIQRCRSRHARKLESEEFRKQLIGKDFDEIRAMLDKDAKEISDKIEAPSRTEDLVAALLRNCLKTIAVSESAWGEEIKTYRAQL